jgi:uncharacterized protein involved in outer membrane biogenesis
MKKILIIVIILLIVLTALFASVYISKDALLKELAERRIEHITGLDMTLGEVKTGIKSTDIGITDIVIRNPKSFKDPVMLDMPYIYADYDLFAILKGEIHLNSMKIDIKEFSIIKNYDGTLNLDSLKPMQQIATQPDAKKSAKKEFLAFKIDELDLKIDRIYYKDYSSGLMPYIRQYDLNIHKRFYDVTSADTVISLIVLEAVGGSGISSFLRLDIKGIKNSIKDTFYTARNLARDTVRGILRFPFGGKKTKEEGEQ